ncbi:MAG: hypothetical protein WDW36_005402 [Sanguina aurantia]
MEWTEKLNPYVSLQLTPGPDVTDAVVKKAYKKMALLKHPDRNRNNPNAAAEFVVVEEAYRVLLDKKAKGALDDYLEAKAARDVRDSKATDKRRKMREELERKEKMATSERTEEEVARMRLKVELDRLRRKAEEEAHQQRMQHAAITAAMLAARSAPTPSATAAAPASGGGVFDTANLSSKADASREASDETKAQLRRSLKVSWDPSSGKCYSQAELQAIFLALGTVEDVMMLEQRKKRKVSALVVMGSEEQAAHAATCVCGDLADPLLVMPLLKLAPEVGQSGPESEQSRSQHQQPGQQHGSGTAGVAMMQGVGGMSQVSGGGGVWDGAVGAGRSVQSSSSWQGLATAGNATAGRPLFPSSAPMGGAGGGGSSSSGGAAPAQSNPATTAAGVGAGVTGGSWSNPHATFLAGGASLHGPSLHGGTGEPVTRAFPLFASSSLPVVGIGKGKVSGCSSFSSAGLGAAPRGVQNVAGGMEAQILEKMRRAAERNKALAAAQAEAAADNE